MKVDTRKIFSSTKGHLDTKSTERVTLVKAVLVNSVCSVFSALNIIILLIIIKY